LLSIAVVLFWSRPSRPNRSLSAGATAPAGPQIRLVTGPEMYADALGRVWQADRFGAGGRIASLAVTVLHTRNPDVSRHYRQGAFRYDLPLAPGVYEMRLHFIEPLFGREGGIPGGEGSRLVQVSMNGNRLLQDLDIFAEAGALSPDVKVFKDVSP